ncbi:hypothetical protein K1W54_21450 [Micromonospora sp. CPCC 205371]|nr:hypothetical protein [Micromonospora sp. CPCC 205371]
MAGYHRAWLAVLAAIGLVLALAAPAPAAATLPPPAWSPAPCATGAITEVRHDVDGLGKPTLWISGWIQPCAAKEFTDGFTVIRYYGGRGIRSRVVPYQSTTAPTSFTFLIDGLRFVLYPNMTALCVAYDYEGRAACLGVDVGGPGQQPVAAPISTDDPRVLVGASREAVYPPNPTCGTCL